MISKLLKYSNIFIIIFSIIFFQFSILIVNKFLEKQEATISITYQINYDLNLYIKNQEILRDIHIISLKNLISFVSDQFNIDILYIKQKNNNVIYWKSREDDKLNDDLKIKIQTNIKKNIFKYLEKNIMINKDNNMRLKEYYETSASDLEFINKLREYYEISAFNLEFINLEKIVMLESFLDHITDHKNFLFYEKLDFLSYKKKVSIIENLIITFVGSILFLIFFINRKNILN